MVSNIGIYKDIFIFKGNEYKMSNYEEFLDKVSTKRKVFFLSQSLLIKKYKLNSNKININDFIENKINEDFSDKDNFLFNYEFSKREKVIYLYSVRNNNLSLLCENAKELSVIPIQFYIRNKILSKIKESRDSIVIFKINDLFHLITLECGSIVNSSIFNSEDEIYKSIFFIKDEKNLIVDNTIKFNFSKESKVIKNTYKVSFVKDIYEKIYSK